MREEDRNFDVRRLMDSNGKNNRFSANFLSLQLQLKTLLEESGGDELIPFLDVLGNLNRSEQGIVLKVLARNLKRLVDSTPRFATDGDLALKDFEDTLYHDLAEAITSEYTEVPKRNRIEVLQGGKHDDVMVKAPIDLEAARRRRKVRPESMLN